MGKVICIGLGPGGFGGVGGQQIGQPVDMVPVVMGQQHQIQAPAAPGQFGDDGGGLGHIHHGGGPGRRIMREIGVIVGQTGDRHDLKSHGVSFRACYGEAQSDR